MKKFFKKIFGGIEMTWKTVIIFAIVMGGYTALMAMLVPDGNSFHDIAVMPEWWVLPAIIIIVNSKKPLESALKTFVFFLISQPLVYLVQVPFNSMGWELFGYYRYWFMITLLTFPGGFIGWYIKKDKWYSGLILSIMTVFLVYMGFGYTSSLIESFPNHLVTIIYCFGIIPIFIFGIFKNKSPRIMTTIITIIAIIIMLVIGFIAKPFEAYTNSFIEDNDIVFVGEPYVSHYSGGGKGNAEIVMKEPPYSFKLTGEGNNIYNFSVSDDENTYDFEYYFDKELNTVIVKKK